MVKKANPRRGWHPSGLGEGASESERKALKALADEITPANEEKEKTLAERLVDLALDYRLLRQYDTGAFTAELDVGPANGSLGQSGLKADGSFTYKPNTGFSGTDSFICFVSGATGRSADAMTVNITVIATGDEAPVPTNSAYVVKQDKPLKVSGNRQPNCSATS